MASAGRQNKTTASKLMISQETYATKLLEIGRKIIRNVTVEPVIFFYAIGFGVTTIITSSLYFNKICKVGSPFFGEPGKTWNDTVCDNLDNGNYNEEQEYVQKTYSAIHTVTMTVKVLPPIIFSLFAGPWSDKFGRRYLIILPLTGYIAYNIWFLINVVYFEELVVEYLMLEVFQYWPGGYMCLFMGSYSIISDHSTKTSRTMRIAIFDFTFLGAMSIGMGISGKINTTFGPAAIYGIGCIFQCLAMSYAIFFVKEYQSPHQTNTIILKNQRELDADFQAVMQHEIPKQNEITLSSMLNINHPKESFQAVLKKRDGGIRHVVVMLVLLFGLYTLQCMGVKMISVSYTRNEFVWVSTNTFNEWWSSYSSIQTVLNCLSLGIILPILSQIFMLHDLTITAICLSSALGSLVVILLAKVPEVLYVSAITRLFAEMTTTSIRSALTKIVGSQDIGKVFACVASIQAMVELVGPLYHVIYLATIAWYSGFAYCVSSLILMLMIAMTVYCRWFVSRGSMHTLNLDICKNSRREKYDLSTNINLTPVSILGVVYKEVGLNPVTTTCVDVEKN